MKAEILKVIEELTREIQTSEIIITCYKQALEKIEREEAFARYLRGPF